MSGFLAVCVRFSLHRGRGWEGEVSKWFLFCSCLVFSRSFVHDCKIPSQGEPKFGQIRAKSKAALKFDIRRLWPRTFNYNARTIRMLRALWSYKEPSLTNHSACLTLAIL